jgi:hypothetical protein
MMHDDGSFAPTRGSAYATTVAVALQDSLTQAAEVFLILPLECVTRRTEAMGEDPHSRTDNTLISVNP